MLKSMAILLTGSNVVLIYESFFFSLSYNFRKQISMRTIYLCRRGKNATTSLPFDAWFSVILWNNMKGKSKQRELPFRSEDGFGKQELAASTEESPSFNVFVWKIIAIVREDDSNLHSLSNCIILQIATHLKRHCLFVSSSDCYSIAYFSSS